MILYPVISDDLNIIRDTNAILIQKIDNVYGQKIRVAEDTVIIQTSVFYVVLQIGIERFFRVRILKDQRVVGCLSLAADTLKAGFPLVYFSIEIRADPQK